MQVSASSTITIVGLALCFLGTGAPDSLEFPPWADWDYPRFHGLIQEAATITRWWEGCQSRYFAVAAFGVPPRLSTVTEWPPSNPKVRVEQPLLSSRKAARPLALRENGSSPRRLAATRLLAASRITCDILNLLC